MSVDPGDAIEARRRKALADFGIDPTDWPLYLLRDEPIPTHDEPSKGRSLVEDFPALSDEAWNLIADVLPRPHANQKLSWRETFDHRAGSANLNNALSGFSA